MPDTYNVFISWSGERSEMVAKALYDWLPMVLQTAKPWMSKEDIEKGSRALDEIGKALEAMGVGIICLTPENVEKPWIHFEAGALSKTMGEKTRVCPYLFGGLRGEQVKLPLGIFQAARAEEKEETRKMVLSVNRALGGMVDEDRVGAWFEREWPALEKKLKEIPAAKVAAHHIDDKKVIAEVLSLAQASANNDAKLRDELRDLREILEEVRPRVPLSAFGGPALPAVDAGFRPLGSVDWGLGAPRTPVLGSVVVPACFLTPCSPPVRHPMLPCPKPGQVQARRREKARRRLMTRRSEAGGAPRFRAFSVPTSQPSTFQKS